MKLTQTIKSLFASRSARIVLVVAGLATMAILPFAAKAEFYPNRPTYDYNKYNGNNNCNDPANPARDHGRCGSLDGPVFNSFINTPSYGDERAFLDARRSDQTAAGSYKNVLPDVTDGSKEVVMRVYIHNNANQDTNASGKGIAHNANVRVALPTATESVLRARAYISASNASMVEDTVDMTATEPFSVSYKPGSAIIYSNGPVNGQHISDNVVTGSGAPIGYSSLNGELPGCFQYEAVVQVTVTITPKQNPNLNLDKEVRKTGDKAWTKEVSAKPGDEVDWLLNTKNTGAASMTDVVTRDVLPPHVQLVPGSVHYYDAKSNSVLQDGPLFQSGYNAGRYDPNDNTLITFKTKVLGDFDACQTRVRNVGHAHSAQFPEVTDTADVVITRDNCQPTTPSFSCDALSATIGDNRKTSFTVKASAIGGAEIKRYFYSFGDGTQEFITDKSTVDHSYAADGQYAARVKVEVKVGDELKIADGDQCATVVNFTTPPNTPPTPGVPATTSTSLPNTGPGDIVGIFAAVFASSTISYYVIVRRLLV